MAKIIYECGSTAGGDLVSPHCPICGAPIIDDGEKKERCKLAPIVTAGGVGYCVVDDERVRCGECPYKVHEI